MKQVKPEEFSTASDPAKNYEVDGGNDGSWCVSIGSEWRDDRTEKVGKIVALGGPKRWAGNSSVTCSADHPDALFFSARLVTADGAVMNVPTRNLIHPSLIPSGSFFTGDRLAGRDVPERKWLVHDLIPSGTVTLLSGDGGTGKSLLALQLAVAVATSTGWLGRGVTGGDAVFLSAEDDCDELHRRLSDVIRANGLTWGDLGNLDLCSMAGEEALLATIPAPGAPLAATALFDRIAAKLEDRMPELLVLDTLADLFPGNENDRAQARQFIGLLRKLAIEHKCAVVLLSHPSLSGMTSGAGTSGSTGWNNSVRSRLYFERVVNEGYEADHNARVLRTMKANYGTVGGEIAMKWQAGVFVADAPETGLDKVASGAKAERVFLSLLRLLTEQGRDVNASSGPNYAPATFEKHPNSEGVRKAAFRAAMDVLLTKGVIRVVEGKRSKHLREVEK